MLLHHLVCPIVTPSANVFVEKFQVHGGRLEHSNLKKVALELEFDGGSKSSPEGKMNLSFFLGKTMATILKNVLKITTTYKLKPEVRTNIYEEMTPLATSIVTGYVYNIAVQSLAIVFNIIPGKERLGAIVDDITDFQMMNVGKGLAGALGATTSYTASALKQ